MFEGFLMGKPSISSRDDTGGLKVWSVGFSVWLAVHFYEPSLLCRRASS